MIYLIIIIPMMLFAQRGKLVGTVIDSKTGEPLPGANVVIEGTLLGASTDIDGLFIILAVDPGTYKVRASSIGYADMVFENIRVSANITTGLDFALKEQLLELQTVVVVAERPLINKNITNSNNIIKSQDLEKLPIRGVNAIVSQQAGIVNQGGNLYVRGSRDDAVAYYIDGVLVNNPVFGGSRTDVITNAIEEIQFQAGGYPAEFGGANGGIISTQTKMGSTVYEFGAEVITDNFAGVGKQYLGGYSYGQNEYIFTAGGPLLPGYKNLKFFIAGNESFQRTPIGFYNGLNLQNVFDPSRGARADTFNIYYPNGYLVNQHTNTYNVQGNITWTVAPITFRVNGSYRYTDGMNGIGIINYRTKDRAGRNQAEVKTGSLKITHALGTKVFYDAIVNYFDDFYVDMDPIFKHNITVYGDSIENARVGTVMQGDGRNLPTMDAYGWNFTRSTVPFNSYRKQATRSLGGRFDFLAQVGRYHELKAGGEFNYYTIRRYSLTNPRGIASLQKSVADGNVYDIYSRLDNYGYDVFGNQINSGLFGPRNPLMGGVYLQDKLEFSDLTVNAGIRLDYFDTDSKEFENPHNVKFNEDGEIDEASLKDVKPFIQLSPRLGFSFPVTEKTKFHAQYGKFYQQTKLRDIYLGYNVVADNIKGGFAISQPVGFGLKPERTTQYELGFAQQFGNSLALDITLFYKDIKDQIQQRTVYAEAGATHRLYYAYLNGDFSTVKGLEFKVDLRRTNRIAASFDYSYSKAMGTGSNPSSSFRTIWQSPTAIPFFPQQIAPLDFNQTHRGNINLDYRFDKNDGPMLFGLQILENSGANLLFAFNSGHSYTRWEGFGNARTPKEALNQSTTPWFFQLDARLDKTFSVGPIDANLYVWVINVLNRKNVINVFNTSGDAYDDGWLASSEGIAASEAYRLYGDEYVEMYKTLYQALTYDANNFGPPRQIRVGLKLDF
jgi:outer membrane receptor protein involved in Fe transport